MISCPIKFVASCFLISSASLLSSPALAQIPITGGRITGDAAFFVPNAGTTAFFDLGTRTLRLVTPNGVTVDSRFNPTFGQIEPIGNRLPTTGDRGILQGFLSGRAFDLSGGPVFFSNIQTQLNFTVNGFNPTGNLIGTLITSTSTPSANIFVPVVGVTLDPLSATAYVPIPGILAVGAFDANLPGGAIALPNTLRFGTPLVNEFAVPDTVISSERRFNFRLEGIGIPNPAGSPGDPSGSFFDPFFVGGVRFSSGNATTDFSLQLDGTPLTITGSGNFATIIEIQGINPGSSAATSILPGQNPLAPAVRYSVIGQGSGSATNSDPLRFSSANSATTFSFQDAAGNVAQGISVGSTNFVIAGAAPFTVSSFSGLTPSPSFNAIQLDNVGLFVAAPVIPPPALIAGGSQTGGSQTGSSANSVTNPGTFILAPTVTFISPRLPQVAVVPTSGAVSLVTIPNPALPGSVVFPGLNSIQVPVTATTPGSNNALAKLLSGQNPSVSDTLALGGDINQFISGLAQSMPVETPPIPSFPISGSNSIVTDTRLNASTLATAPLGTPSSLSRMLSSMGITAEDINRDSITPANTAARMGITPADLARDARQGNSGTSQLEAFLDSEAFYRNVRRDQDNFESKKRINVGPGGEN